MELKKQLSFIAVFCIAAGAMISSGIFILPGLAFERTGPAMIVSYSLAGIMALIGVLSVVELATAMPKAGGDYYFINRSLGPFMGTLSGIFSWVAISLKSAFAIYGLAEVIYLLTGIPLTPLALFLCAGFVSLNIYGVHAAAKVETALVVGLLGLMVLYIAVGSPAITISRFEPFFTHGTNGMLSTAGFVFVSFGGLISVASVAEEVKNPRRNLPLGLLSAVIVVTLIYALLLAVTVGVLPAERLQKSLTPIADAARIFLGTPGFVIITIAAMLAFITTAIAGIMSASRYPLALSRDQLLPPFFGQVSARSQTPVLSLLLTGIFIAIALLLPLDLLVKAASTVILSANVFANVAVIILRESRLQNYQPTFRTPLYPWLPVFSIVIFSFFIIDMGLATIEISVGLLVTAVLVYLVYGRKRSVQEYALLHLVARITDREFASHSLEAELREIIRARDDIVDDPFDRLVHESPVLDLDHAVDRDELFQLAAARLTDQDPARTTELARLLAERETVGSTVVSPSVAIPHVVLPDGHALRLLIARCRDGVRFAEDAPAVQAVFVLIGDRQVRNRHLRALAAIAQIVQGRQFQSQWQNARTEAQLRDILLLTPRRRT